MKFQNLPLNGPDAITGNYSRYYNPIYAQCSFALDRSPQNVEAYNRFDDLLSVNVLSQLKRRY